MRFLPFIKARGGCQFAGGGLDTSGGGGGGYTLPVATSSRLGGVKIGQGVNVESDGTISVSGGGGSLPNYSTSEFDTGRKWIDGKTIYGMVIHFQYGKPSLAKDTWVAITQQSTTTFPASSVTQIIDCRAYKDVNAQICFVGGISASIANNKLQVYNSTADATDVENIYIEYTK